MPARVFAQQAQSTNYSVDQVFFGNGGELNACSTNYCSKQAAGETTVGNTSSTNYQAQTGHNIDREVSLELIVNNALCPNTNGSTSLNLGYLGTGSATTAKMNFSVKTYLSGGYIVTTAGTPPSISGHTFTALSNGTSSPGTEQFGINLVANSSPSVGSDPTSLPDNSFGYGVAASGYNTPNQFSYTNGATIASSPKSSGVTCFTMSYLFNINGRTPAGEYKFNQSIVATSTF